MKMKKKLNLGCGKNIRKDFINLDIVKNPGVDIVHDLNQIPYPFKKNEFSYIFADNILEHVDDLIKILEEIHRISENKAVIDIIVPYFSNIGAYQDPTHKHFFTLKSFDYFTRNFYYNYYTNVRFKMLNKKLIFSRRLKVFEKFFNKYQKMYESLFVPYLIPASAIRFRMMVVK